MNKVSFIQEFNKYLQGLVQHEKETGTSIFDNGLDDVMNMSVEDGEYVSGNEDTFEKNETADSEESNDGIDITLTLNALLQDENVVALLDADGNGDLNDDEMNTLLNELKEVGQNNGDISLTDVLSTIENVGEQNGAKDNALKNEEETKAEDAEKPEESKEAAGETETASGNETGNTNSGNSTTGTGLNTSGNSTTSGISEKNLDSMTKEELNAELADTEKTQAEKEENVDKAINGETELLQTIKQAEEEAYQNYQDQLEELNVEYAEKVDELKTKIDDQDKLITDKEHEISNQESTVNQDESAYRDAVATREGIEASEPPETIPVYDEEGNQTGSEPNPEHATWEAELAAAKEREAEALETWEDSKEKLETLKTQKEDLISGPNGRNDLDQQMAELEQEIMQKHPEVQQAMMDYNEAKQDYRLGKDQEIAAAKSELNEVNSYISNIQSAINTKEINEKKRERDNKYNQNEYNTEAGEKLAENAKITDGTTGWCLKGVADSLMRTFGVAFNGKIGSAYMAADALRGKIEGCEEISKYFKEVTVDRSELSNLPAGAVVVWDNNKNGGGSNVSQLGKEHGHISIALGNGKESSDHIENQTVNRDAEFTVFYPIAV